MSAIRKHITCAREVKVRKCFLELNIQGAEVSFLKKRQKEAMTLVKEKAFTKARRQGWAGHGRGTEKKASFWRQQCVRQQSCEG